MVNFLLRTIALFIFLTACTTKAFTPLTKERVGQMFASLKVEQDGNNFEVIAGPHTFTVLHNGQCRYIVYEKMTDVRFGEHYEPTLLAKSYEAKINEKRK